MYINSDLTTVVRLMPTLRESHYTNTRLATADSAAIKAQRFVIEYSTAASLSTATSDIRSLYVC